MLIVLPDELEVLRTMQPLDRDVFHCIAERMDIKTGIIGKRCRISYGGIAYDLSEHDGERRCKSSLRKLTIDQVRNAVRRLIRQGLLMSLSEKGKGSDLLLVRVFWVDCLGLGSCEQKPDARSLPDQMTRAINFLHNHINKIQETEQGSCQQKTRPDAITYITQHTTYRDDEFSMMMDWQPSADEYEMALHRAGFSVDKVDQAWVVEWIAFWALERNRGRRYTQRGWTLKLAMAMVDYLRNPGLYEKRRGISQASNVSGDKPKQSVMPEWSRMPRDDEELMAWAMRHGYGAADVGWTYLQYRGVLRAAIESRLKQWRQLS